MSQHPLALIAGVIDVLDNTDGTCRVSAKVSVIHKTRAKLLLCMSLSCCLFLLLKPLRLYVSAALNALKQSLVA